MSSEQSGTNSLPPISASARKPGQLVEGPSFPIVGIGASAGGLEAFTKLLRCLPLDTGLGFVLVQHLDPQHESALKQILTRATSLPVHEVENNLRVEPNHVYVIPPNTKLGIAQGVLNLQPWEQTRTPQHPIDFFLESLAEDQHERAIGVILSGTATDGTLGLEAIKAEGGITFAQDDSARYDSMPRSAVTAGCVDFVLSPENIAKELARIARHPYVASDDWKGVSGESGIASEPDVSDSSLATRHWALAPDGFNKILLLLRNHSRVDFSLYKPTTIRRRIARRMVLNRQDTLANYARFLGGNTHELDALYSDALISVTSFFRNPEVFDSLRRKVFPKAVQERSDDPFRIWVLGCSTGQEAYSIAMTFVEEAEKAPPLRKLQVFATDLNEALLDRARYGFYAKNLVQDVSPERLRRFFVEEEGGYRVNKALRELVVFARQNLISDPPFSRMDLISCRNLLIYFEPSLQKKALPTFHYALKPTGFLLLGASETIGSFTNLFEPADKKHRLYSKKMTPTRSFQLPAKNLRGVQQTSLIESRETETPFVIGSAQAGTAEDFGIEVNAQREADRIIVSQFAPPGLLINAELQVLQFRGSTGAFLELPSGKASFDVLKMVREGLKLPLRAAINKAKKENIAVRKENVRLRDDGKTRKVSVEVIPLKNVRERCFLILFGDSEKEGHAISSTPSPKPAKSGDKQRKGRPTAEKESPRVVDLESELAETRDYLQAIQEQHEAANEELQASNEEVQSANEELQSINEELETSKEELESANEELTTVNEEMSNRNAELNRLNSDLLNIQTSAHLAIVLLGRDLTIRRFSAQAAKEFNLLATDLGRPFSQVRHNLVFEERRLAASAYPTLRLETGRRYSDRQAQESTGQVEVVKLAPTIEGVVAEVIDSVGECEREMHDKEGRWYSLRVRPYLTLDNKVDGAVMALMDITALKRTEQTIAAARDYVEAILQTTRDPLLILDADLRVHTASQAFYKTFKVSPTESEGQLIYELGNRQWDIPNLRQLLEEILPRNGFFNNFEVRHDFERIGRRTMLLNARSLNDTSGRPAKILLGIEDVTEVLSENAEKFKLLFDRSPLPKWVVDLETLRFLDVNETAVEHYGYSREEFLRMSVLDVRTPESGKVLQARLARPPYHPAERDSCQHRKKSGEVIDVELRSSEITFAGKQVWLVSVNDITERKRAEEGLRRAMEFDEAVMTNMGEGLYTVDAQGLVTSMNPAAEKLFGWKLEELRGKKMHDMTHYKHPDGRPYPHEECAGFQVLKEGKTLADHEDVFIRKDGTFFDVVYSSSPLYEGDNLTGLVVVFRDVSERKRAEEALRKSEQRFAKFMQHLPGLAWIKDAEGRYVYANDSAEKAFSTSQADVYGKTDEELFPPETAAQFMRNDQQALASGSGIQTIESLTHGDGIVHHSIVSKFPIPSGTNGEDIMVGGVAFDITEQKQAEEAQKKLAEQLATELAATQQLQQTSTQLIREGNPDVLYQQILSAAITIMHSDMASIQMVDDGQDALRLLAWRGFDSEFGQIFELNGLDTRTSCSIARREGRRVVVPDVETCEFIVGTTALEDHRKTGIRAVQSTPLISRDGRMLGIVSTHWRNPHDPAERDLRLLDILARQAADIIERARAEDALREADRRKNEFLAMLAHELRNPLAPISNALAIVRLADGNEETVRSASEMMERQIGQMVRLVDDLLDVSRISRGKIELRTGLIDLVSTVHHAVEAVRPLCESKGLNLTVTLPPHPVYLNADPVRLAQVVGNLLNNACKFTNTGGSIELVASVEGRVAGGEKSDEWRVTSDEKEESSDGGTRLSATQGSDDIGKHDPKLATRHSSLTTPYVTISVRDNGIGIPMDQLPRIFELFAQVDTSLERTRSGLGIGLTLAKNLVELHGGELEGRSAGLGQGSEFVVRLPVSSDEWRVTSGEKAQSGGNALATDRKRILVVDDNLDSAESLTILLDLEGNETHTAYDGLEALAAAANFRPDVILLDIGLPGLNGYDVARRIREQPWGKHIMLVALTGWGQEEDRRRSHDAGFDHHLTKPVDSVALKKLLVEGPRDAGHS